MRITSPPITHPCFYGVDMATRGELIGANLSTEEIREHIGADSLGYLSLDGTIWAANIGEGQHCTACFSGTYPSAVPLQFDKFSLEGPQIPDHEIPMVREEPAAEIAGDLEMTAKAVRQAKFRVLRRLREELRDLL